MKIMLGDRPYQDVITTQEILQKEYNSRLRFIGVKKIVKGTLIGFLGHLLFWTNLIVFYPKSSWIQAIFFWNPKVRKWAGFWYVDFALNWIPFLRSRLFFPFRESLLADAHLDTLDPNAYFPNSHVKPKQRIVVYLPAKKCDRGVLEAIKHKLHGQVKEDLNFLRNLIYSGAMDICIDGLNEVTPDTRATITHFVESYFKMLSNPMELTVVAQMLAEKKTPDLLKLQEEQYEMMAADYDKLYPVKQFPLKAFSEVVYQMRLNDE